MMVFCEGVTSHGQFTGQASLFQDSNMFVPGISLRHSVVLSLIVLSGLVSETQRDSLHKACVLRDVPLSSLHPSDYGLESRNFLFSTPFSTLLSIDYCHTCASDILDYFVIFQ